MRKALLAAVAAIALIGSTAVATPEPAPFSVKKLIEKVSPSIVRVTSEREFNGEKGTYVCAGTVVHGLQHHVLTAEHCVSDNGKLVPVDVDGVRATLLKVSADLVLLSVPDLDKPSIAFRKEHATMGEVTYAFGFGYGRPTVLMRPIIWLVTYHNNNDQEELVVDGPFINGMSGGPVVDADGNMLGVVQKSNPALGFASGPDIIKAFLR